MAEETRTLETVALDGKGTRTPGVRLSRTSAGKTAHGHLAPGGRLGPVRAIDIALSLLVLACAWLAADRTGSIPLRVAVPLLAVAVAAFTAHSVRRLEQHLEEARKVRNYRLVEPLGRGGMGEVWRAEHHLLPRSAAIKFIRPEALHAGSEAEHDETVREFLEEARATSKLTSPHTIEIHDFGVTPDGVLCYVMEFLDGMDLETIVREEGPLPPARVVYLLRQVCISLAEAHQEGLVHRDIKPANVYVCRKGIHFDFVKVLDFGIAAETSTDVGTRTGEPHTIVGTPGYLAPETILGRGFDARADIYAMGCVAYWLLTGEELFPDENVAEKLRRHVHDRPPPPTQRADRSIPRDLELVVLECLRKNPDERIRSASELSSRLARCRVGAAWTPGQAMEWWEARRRTPPQRTARSGTALLPRPARRPSPRHDGG